MTTREPPRVPVGPDKMRKTLTLPKTLVAKVRQFRHSRMFDQESDAYVALIEAGLEALQQEQQDQQSKR